MQIAKYNPENDGDFWLNTVRRLGSNSAVDGFGSLEDLIMSGRLTESQLRSLASACRSLEGMARTQAGIAEAKRKRPWEFRTKAA